MNIGKLQGWDNIPYREIFLTTGQKIGIIMNGVELHFEDEGIGE